ncbi:ABC transporter ATP-binding protein [Kluyvera cryocrescens]|uniref:ABC transporter ATP-binding protein n=1 Tax=Kluyvera cryocrescens TaxID=580 RepID=UPI00155E987A|nr:ABC transporter ATP-binding protein [Kluyvera cryocrescens]
MSIISVRNLGKAYKLYPSKFAKFIEWISPIKCKKHDLKWILKDVNVDIHRGESIGVIGSNGAGKSTFLKIITGTISQTEGVRIVNGRISALLELGIGFHPDFTGRQNVYMSGQLLGMTIDQINDLMVEIEDFAEIGSYIDQPVRVYSSGMQVRLAFSLATAIRPDILIVDEALAVGDIFFQQKCYERISEMRKKGTTLLLVTHDMGAIYRLCDKAIYISSGTVKSFGDVRSVIADYEIDLKKLKRQETLDAIKNGVGSPKEMADSDISHNKVEFINSAITIDGKEVTSLDEECAFTIEVEIEKKIDIEDDVHVGFQIRDAKGNIYYETNTYCQKKSVIWSGNRGKATFELRNNLCQGSYVISFGIDSGGYGTSSFKENLLHNVGSKELLVVRTNIKIWAGLCNMRVK